MPPTTAAKGMFVRSIGPVELTMRNVSLLAAVAVSIAAAFGYSASRSSAVRLDSPAVDVGVSSPGTERTASVVIRNESREAVTVLGAASSCSCVVTDSLPLEVEAGADHELRIQVKYRGEPGESFRHTVVFFTDAESAGRLQVELSGTIAGASPRDGDRP